MEIPGIDRERLKSVAWLRRLVRSVRGGDHWARVVQGRETDRMMRSLGALQNLSAFDISGGSWRHFGFGSYKCLNYPEFDICRDVLDEKFDVIIAEHVFEHLLWPYRAARNVFAMLKPGGAFLVVTPFLIRVHDYPVDCSRWTELGIKHFLAEAGFDLDGIETGSWGNRACVKANFHRWRFYRPWMGHSLKNEPNFPVTVWALARKSVSAQPL